MKIILSPAKQMVQEDTLPPLGMPVFLQESDYLLSWMKYLSPGEAQKLWRCSDKLARQAFEMTALADVRDNLSPAVLAYDGIAFQYMAPAVFERAHFEYIQEHLRILSGLYGVLKPMDGVTSYRLEMQSKISAGGFSSLYDFWGRKIYAEVTREDDLIVNLASKEYSRCVEKYLERPVRIVTCFFGEAVNGRLVQRGVHAKMARGAMVRFLAEYGAEEPEAMKDFRELGFEFSKKDSSPEVYVFIRKAKSLSGVGPEKIEAYDQEELK